MKKFRFWLTPLAAILMVGIPATALADLYINGTGELRTYDVNAGCKKDSSKTFRCDFGSGQSTAVSFYNASRRNGCGVRVYNKGNPFSSKWHIEFSPGGWATEKCRYSWVNDNTVDIIEPEK